MNNSFLKDFFDTLNGYGIAYCVLRNYDTLPESTGGSDVDMWVRKEDCQRFFDLTMELTKRHKGHLVSYIWKRHEPKICLMGEDWGVQIDVYTGLVPIGNKVFYTGQLIEQHTIIHNSIKVLAPHWAAIEAFLKEVLNNGHCNQKEKYYIDASDAVRTMGINELKSGLPMFSDNFIELLNRIGHEDKSEELISKISQTARKELNKRVDGSFWDGLLKFKRIFRRPGFMIAILGTDGSGKSAIYSSIYPYLEGAFHKGVYYSHLRPHLLPDIGVIIGNRKNDDTITVCKEPHAKKPSGFAVSLVRILYYLQDYFWGYWIKIWPKIATHSHVFILDRYYYDYYIDQNRSRTSLPYSIIRILELFVPKPDLILCLGGDPNIIFKRKPETSLEEVKRQMKALKAFCDKRKNAVWFDTTGGSLEDSTNNVMDVIVKFMNNRFANISKL